ncbi:MAG: DnaJ domain-containing protein [Azonexaceae bacterium]|uniref:DnaJ domain-containing protein n=1 Tax=Azonexus sp. R2A61 TaxID=2744443 RepID=UPI001F3D24F6|nr:J domain-containing protein [Azonexus sp. R2A61]MCE1238679.1 DnaJ domain-containing protein [Azonexaceae bacterium]
MKSTFYDLLQVSSKASDEVISAAYEKLSEKLKAQMQTGDQDARNQLIFVEEAYATLSIADRRRRYDATLNAPSDKRATPQSDWHSEAFAPTEPSLAKRMLLGGSLCLLAFGAYKFLGQNDHKAIQEKQISIQERRDNSAIQTDTYRAENERMQIQGSINNQEKLIDRSYEIAQREAEQRQRELEYRANAQAQMLEMQRERHEARVQAEKWQQAQIEKETKMREEKMAADEPKRQLCRMYALNGKTADYNANRCYRY